MLDNLSAGETMLYCFMFDIFDMLVFVIVLEFVFAVDVKLLLNVSVVNFLTT